MSRSPEKAAQELEAALEFGRCPVCERINCEFLEGSCTCCGRCGNSCASSDESCTCCPHCDDALNICNCDARLKDIWSEATYCWACPRDKHGLRIVHQVDQPCPLCCAYCKELEQDCICSNHKCGTTPCICCTRCGDFRIKCRCWGAKILSHFMRRAVLNHKMQQKLRESYFPVNTAALITVKSDDW